MDESTSQATLRNGRWCTIPFVGHGGSSMSNLETRLAEWRARMAKVLPQSEAALDELEEHLRERVAELESHGTSEDDAFAIAQAGIGEPHVIAREFDRIPGRWRPGLISLPALALI